MKNILRKMQETVEVIDKASTVLSSDQLEWAMWWKRHLAAAITKANLAGWNNG
jgi:hypothetical protein